MFLVTFQVELFKDIRRKKEADREKCGGGDILPKIKLTWGKETKIFLPLF